MKTKKISALLTFLLVFSSFGFTAEGSVNKEDILKRTSSLQIPFIENKGQIKGEDVRFYAKTFAGTVFITMDGEIVYSLPTVIRQDKKTKNIVHPLNPVEKGTTSKGWVIKERFVGASISDVRGEEGAITKVSYFKGRDPSKWKRNIPTYNTVNLGEVYKGIELKLNAYGNNFEKLFYVKPNGNSEGIKIKIEGAKGLNVNEEGELEIETGIGVFKFTKPVAYQKINGKRIEVAAAYNLQNLKLSNPNPELFYGFKIGKYDRTRELIIDPLLASTFLGDESYDRANSISIDKNNGNVYVTGWTESNNFPTTPSAYDTFFNGGYDAFVSKFDNNLQILMASTFLGGMDIDMANSISIDNNGSIYVTGWTESNDFPITVGNAYDTTYNGGGDAFVSKFDNNLQILMASTFLGGMDVDGANSISINNNNGRVYVTGWTESNNFPTTPSAYDTFLNGGYDAFVSKLTGDLKTLLVSTFLGGMDIEEANSISVDSNGDVYVTGRTKSGDFPTTHPTYDIALDGIEDAFVSKLDKGLKNLMASTFLGGMYIEEANSISIDNNGDIYVAGWTASSDFPTYPNSYDITLNGKEDAFVSRFTANLQNLLASTFLGGMDVDRANSISIYGEDVYVAGWTRSPDFPTPPLPYAYDTTCGTDGNCDSTGLFYYEDAFVSKLDNALFAGNIDIAVGQGLSATSLVRDFYHCGSAIDATFITFGPAVNPDRTVRVAKGDVTGDGIPEIVTGTYGGTLGTPAKSLVRVFDLSGTLIAQFVAFGPAVNPTGNIDVGLGDLDMDGINEIIVGVGDGGNSRVRIFDDDTSGYSFLAAFIAYGSGLNPSGAVYVDGGYTDITSTKPLGQIVVGTGSGSSRVRIFDYGFPTVFFNTINTFGAINPSGRVDVGVGDLNGDGIGEIVVGAGDGGNSRVRVFNENGAMLDNFVAFGPGLNPSGLVNVSTGDADADGIGEIIVGTGM